jgi:peptide/nickel transport system substrate-binding protein
MAKGESRPHYGGTLRVAVKEAPASIDPAGTAGASFLTSFVFETLVRLDGRGTPQPHLATSWQAESGDQRWRFFLRNRVTFSDGTRLDAATAAASLRAANADWKVIAVRDAVMIETASPRPELPAELALASNAIARHDNGKAIGTGPFLISQFDPGKHLLLKASDQYWNGRPFLDSVEIDLGKSYREQSTLFDIGKADVIEISPENIHRAEAAGRTVVSSRPFTLMALVFAEPSKSADEAHARNAFAMSIDTAAINHVVVQDGGEPTGALLPNWLSGYAFVFPGGKNADVARREKLLARRVTSWTLRYDAGDPVSRVVAERIQLNARDIGITIQLAISGASDLNLIEISPSSSDPRVELRELAAALGLPAPKLEGNSAAALYQAERQLLDTHQVIPLLHLKSAISIRGNVHAWNSSPSGEWGVDDVWLSPEKP